MMPSKQGKATGRLFPRLLSAFGALTAGGLVLLALLAAGCGGSSGRGVAQVPSTKTSATGTGSRSGSSKADPAAYSACMRKHGVSNFPDPDGQGRIKVSNGVDANGHRTGVDTNALQFQTAQNACKSLQPNGGKPNAQAQAKEVQQALAFARCMRSHGVPKFPDPKVTADGGMLQGIGGNTGVDPNSPQFKAAEKACQKLVPGEPGRQGSGTSAAGQGGTP
jgi:hypothetical protein